MTKQQINKKHGRYIVKAFSVIEFLDEEDYSRVFEAIPDTWFTDETKTFCYWPPRSPSSKNLMLLAMNCVRPDDDSWNTYACKVVSGGHASYALAYKVVREKCSQKYNTSSADDRMEAENYRRKHPVLALQGDKSFEKVFRKKSAKHQVAHKDISEANNAQSPNRKILRSDDCSTKMVESGSNSDHSESVSLRRRSKSSKTSNSQRQLPVMALQGKTADKNVSDVNNTQSSNLEMLCSNENSNAPIQTVENGSNSDHLQSSTGRSESSKTFNSQTQRLQATSSPPSNSREKSTADCGRNEMSHSGSRFGSSRSRSRSLRSQSGNSQSRSGSSRSRSGSSRSRSGCSRSRSESSRSRSCNSRSQSGSSRSRSGSSRSRSGSYRSRSGSSRSRSGSSRSRSGSFRSSSGNSRSLTYLRERAKKRLLGAEAYTKKRREVPPVDRHSKPRTQTNYSSDRSQLNSAADSVKYPLSSASRRQLRENPPLSTAVSISEEDSLVSRVDRLIKLMEKCDKRQDDHERRLTRIEVTLYKTFVMVGDLINAKNSNVQLDGNKRSIDLETESETYEFDEPKFPIASFTELDDLKKNLKNRRYKRFLIAHERDYCTPSKKSTHSVTVTKYLKRFVSMNVRCSLTFKERSGKTLMGEYKRVYGFLVDVIRSGYRMCHQFITKEEAHTALRIVWGRSKQYKNIDDQKKQQRNALAKKTKRSRRHH